MTELKTLKDMEVIECMRVGNPKIVYSEDLRAEAIKHIKVGRKFYDPRRIIAEIKEKNKQFTLETGEQPLPPEDKEISRELYRLGIEKEAQERWIKHFFNITEEDLT